MCWNAGQSFSMRRMAPSAARTGSSLETERISVMASFSRWQASREPLQPYAPARNLERNFHVCSVRRAIGSSRLLIPRLERVDVTKLSKTHGIFRGSNVAELLASSLVVQEARLNLVLQNPFIRG